MDPDRSALLADIDSWLTAGRALSDVLEKNIAEVGHGRELVADDVRLSEAIGAMGAAPRYLRMGQALAEFELARFALRSSLISAALAEGLDADQLVKLLGVPLELTSRVLDELTDAGP